MEKKDTTKFTVDWTAIHVPTWKWLPKFNNMLEIGTFEGCSAIWFLKNKVNRLTVIDDWKGHIEAGHEGMTKERFLKNIKPFKDRVKVMEGNSYKNLIRLLFLAREKFDLIYVDAGHSAKECLSDCILAWELLKDNGVMIMDDYNYLPERPKHHRPKTAIDCFLNCYKEEYKILFKNDQVIIRKTERFK